LVIFILIALLFVIVSDIIPQWSDKEYKTFWLNAILTVICIALFVLSVMDVDLPSPVHFIEKMVKLIYGDMVSRFGR